MHSIQFLLVQNVSEYNEYDMFESLFPSWVCLLLIIMSC